MASQPLTLAAVRLFAQAKERGNVSHSRSTSAGSSSSPSCREAAGKGRGFHVPPARAGEAGRSMQDLEELEYPSAVVIKNTFLDSPVERPASLEGFFRQREVHSCPPGAIAARLTAEEEEEEVSQAEPEPLPATPFPSYLWEAPLPAAGAPAAAVQAALQFIVVGAQVPAPPTAPPAMMAPAMLPDASPPPPQQQEPAGDAARLVIRLSDVCAAPRPEAGAPRPQVGTPEMPTVGSLGHRHGNCKPCAFMHTKGCTSGALCEFCHLCDKGERKRRQKQKHALEAQQLKEQEQREREQQQLQQRQRQQRNQRFFQARKEQQHARAEARGAHHLLRQPAAMLD